MRNSVSPALLLVLAAMAAPLAAQSLPGLENFSIERPAPPPVVTPSPVPTTASPTPAAPAPTPSATAPSPTPTAPSPAATASPTSRATSTTPAATSTPDVERSPAATATLTPPPAAEAPIPTETATPLPPTTTEASAMPSWLVWLLAAIGVAVVAGAAWWMLRRRAEVVEDEVYVPEPVAPPTPAPPPPPAPAPAPAAAPAPAPSPAPPAGLVTTSAPKVPGGLVTTAFRPEIDFRLLPVRAGIDTLRATLEFSLTVANTGRGAAHDVIVEAWLMAADRDPRGLIAELLSQDANEPILPPFALPATAAVDVPGQAATPREQLATITAGTRKLFVPMLVVRALWHDGRGRQDGAGAAFMVGVPREGQDRLAPLPLDRGARGYTTLAALRFDA